MSLTLQATMQDAIATAINTLINTGAGTATIKLETSGDAEVATFDLQNPAFTLASPGLLTIAGLPIIDVTATGGTATKFSVYDRDNVKQFEGTVTATGGGGDIELPNTTVTAGSSVQLNTFSLQVPA